jgi:translocation and assembly module TamA
LPLAWWALVACGGRGARPDAPLVDSVEIEGAKAISDGELKQHIVTSEATFLPFDTDEPYDPNAWQADLRRIERYYQAHGYYNVAILEESVTPLSPKKVRIKVRLEEGEPVRVGSLEVTGLEALPTEHRETAMKSLPISLDKPFLEESWESLKSLLLERLRELGYAEAELEGEALVEPRDHRADLKVTVTPGVRYKFGPLFVATDPGAQVHRKRVVEQAEGAIDQGDWYSDSALQEAQTRIFSMGVFAAVKVGKGKPEPERGIIPIVIDVREAPFRSVRSGFGIGLDSGRNELRLLADFTHRNFLGDLRRFTLSGKAGYAFLPSIPDVLFNPEVAGLKSGPIVKLRAEFEQPHFLFRYVRFQTSLEGEHGIEPAYTFNSARLRTGLVWQPLPALSIVPSYNLEVYGLPEGDARAQRTLPLGCTNCWLSFVEQRVEWDGRDNPLEPKQGAYAALALQEGGGPLSGSFSYLRFFPDVRAYVTPGEGRLTLAGKLRFGTLIPFAPNDPITGLPTSPVVARFYSGGADMRGFNSRRLSPMIVVPRIQDLDSNGNPIPGRTLQGEALPIGGNGLFEGSIEARYLVTEKLVVAVFFDTGFVTEEAFRFDAFSQLQYAVGLGLRFPTLVGPIRIDLAYRLNIGPSLPLRTPLTIDPATGQIVPQYPPVAFDGARGCFVGGFSNAGHAGFPESPCAFHIFIGEAF